MTRKNGDNGTHAAEAFREAANGHKRAILYARVSTDEQAEKGYSLPTQFEAMRKYAAEHGFTVVAEIQDDYSGAKLDRPGLIRLRAMIDRGEADAVICYSVDRLSRNPGHAWELAETWHRAGIELHFCNRGRSDNTPEGTMTYGFESLFAYYYRAKTMEATERGRRAKAKSGKWVGAGFAPYGYRRVGKGPEARLEICEPEAAVVRRIFALYTGANGSKPMPLQAIAEMLTQERVPLPGRGPKREGRGWWPTTLRRLIIDRRAYIGEFEYAGYALNYPELAIIDRETWEAARTQRERNAEKSRHNRKKHDYLLSGYLYCTCGAKMRGNTPKPKKKKAKSYYHCWLRAGYAHLTDCKAQLVRVDKADALVWGWFSEIISDDEKREKGIREYAAKRESELQPNRARLALYDEGIAKVKRQIARLARDLHELESDEGREALRREMDTAAIDLKAKQKEHSLLAAEIEQSEITQDDIEYVRWVAACVQGRLGHNPTCEQKQEALDIFDLRVQLRHDESGRWLDCTCGIGKKSLLLDGQSNEYQSSRRSIVRPSRP